MGSFYNTIHQTGKDLFSSNEGARTQEEIIHDLFKAKRHMEGKLKFTPFEVLERMEFMGYKYPITSIRRAMSNLTKQGILEKTDEKKDEEYGKPNYYWRLK
jgi:hypothetical protein